MDDIAAGVDNSDEMIPVPRNFSDHLRHSGVKFAHKCEYEQ